MRVVVAPAPVLGRVLHGDCRRSMKMMAEVASTGGVVIAGRPQWADRRHLVVDTVQPLGGTPGALGIGLVAAALASYTGVAALLARRGSGWHRR